VTKTPLRTKADPVCGRCGCSPKGKMLVANRHRSGNRPARRPPPGRDQGLFHRLVAWLHRGRLAPGATIKTDGRPSLHPAPDVRHEPCRRRHGRPCRSAQDPPRLLQRQDLGAPRLSGPATTVWFCWDQCNMVTDRSGKVSLRNRTTRFSSRLFVVGILNCLLAG
jgi:hypothetical protein